jgi:hypothetical protein
LEDHLPLLNLVDHFLLPDSPKLIHPDCEDDHCSTFGKLGPIYNAATVKVPTKVLYFPDKGHWMLDLRKSQLWYKTVNYRGRLLMSLRRASRDKLILDRI